MVSAATKFEGNFEGKQNSQVGTRHSKYNQKTVNFMLTIISHRRGLLTHKFRQMAENYMDFT